MPREYICVRVLVPHDHMRRDTVHRLELTADVARRIEKGFLLEVECS